VATGGSSAIATADGGCAGLTSTSGAGGAATALADAIGGAVSSSAAANAGAGRGTGLGGTALATAEGSGTWGSLSSHVTTGEASTQLITNLSATGSAPVNGASETESSAKYTGAAPTNVTGLQSISQIVGDPSSAAGNAVLNANPNIKTGFGSSPSFYAIGELGGSYTPSGTSGEVSTSSVSFTLNEADLLSGKSLQLGLYNGDEVGASGVTGISLTATGNGTNLLSSPINSASQFHDHSINLGALGTSGTLDVVLTLTVDQGGRRRVLRRFPPGRSASSELPLGPLAPRVECGAHKRRRRARCLGHWRRLGKLVRSRAWTGLVMSAGARDRHGKCDRAKGG
jgi:hypothetical protein